MNKRTYRNASVSIAAVTTLLSGVVIGAGGAVAFGQGTVKTQAYTIGNGPVSNATAVAEPDTAGASADYTVGFTSPSALAKGSTITLSAPNGRTIFPSATTDYFVVDNSHTSGSQPVTGAALATGAHGVTLVLSAAVDAGSSLSLYIESVTNPVTPGPYSLDVSTSANPSPASTATYQIVAASSTPSFSPTAAPPLAGSLATYTIGAFKASSSLVPGASITLTSTAASAGATDNVAFPSVTADYKVTDLTTQASSVPGTVRVASLGAGPNGQSVTLQLGAPVTAGDELSVTMAGSRNPSDTQTDTISAAAPSSASAVSAPLAIGTSVTNPTVSLSQSTANATGVEYSVGFRSFSTLAPGATVTLLAPPGTSFAASSVTVFDDTHAAASANVPAGSVKAAPSGSSSTDNQVTFSLPNAIAAGDTLTVDITGATNPAAGDYGGSAGNLSIATSADSVAVNLPAYVVTAAPAPVLATIGLSSTAPGASAQYSIGDLRATGTLAAGTATIELRGPAGTVFQGAVGDYDVVDLTHGFSSHPVSITGAATNDVILTLGASVTSGDFLEIVADGVVNPAPGSYSISLAGDIEPAVPPTPPSPVAPPVPSARTTTALSASPNPVLTGRTVDLTATVSPRLAGGTVNFTVDGTSLSGCTLRPVVNGQANCSTSFPTAGLRNIGAIYSGMSGFASSSALVGEHVTASAEISLSSSANPAPIGKAVTYTALIVPRVSAGVVEFTKNNGTVVNGCADKRVVKGQASCAVQFWYGGDHPVTAHYSGMAGVVSALSARRTQSVDYPAKGYWLLTKTGDVYGEEAAPSLGGATTSASTGPAVGIASTPTAKGYWTVTARGAVSAFGDAKWYGDLPAMKVRTLDIVAIAPTHDGRGYWLVGRDGGLFAFGDAKFHGSLPGIGKHVRDVTGMVASPDGAGYMLVGSDGGVFTFGSARFYGSLPGIGKHVNDIRAILPSRTGTGYILVGSDGGAFTFGSVRFYGSLPGRDVTVDDIVGIALTPDNGGYFMAGADGAVFGFGDATAAPAPSGLNQHLPVVAIAGT